MAHTNRKPTQYLVFSELSFLATLLLCVVLIPTTLTGTLGLSFYGNYRLTIVPYVIGFLLCSYFIIKAAKSISKLTHYALHRLSGALDVLALLALGVMLTPYSIDALFHLTHIVISTLLFLLEFALSVWMMASIRRDWLSRLLFGLLLIGMGLALFSVLKVIGFMLLGQFIVQVAFGVLLIRAIDQLTRQTQKSKSQNLVSSQEQLDH